MGRESDNFTAEMLVKQLGRGLRGLGLDGGGPRVIRDALGAAGVPLAGVRLADGSGLSRLDRLTAAAVVALLEAGLAEAELRDAFLQSLAVAGVNGTLEDRMEQRPGARPGDREDGDDAPRVGALRLRPRPLRLRGPPERPPDLDLLGAAGAGPVRDRAAASG